MKKLLFILFISVLFPAPVFCLTLSDIKEYIRPYYEMIIGNKQEVISLPQIPRIIENATSTQTITLHNKNIKLNQIEIKKYNYLFIKELYIVIRGDTPSSVKLNQWQNVLDQGGTREGIYRAMVLDNYYFSLENNANTLPSARLQKYTTFFLEKYISQTINKQSLSTLNPYRIKKIAVSKALDIIDLFTNTTDLYNWYAILSADLAKQTNFNSKNILRNSTSPQDHKKWAKQVPIQHIKSELIIKMHITFNKLM